MSEIISDTSLDVLIPSYPGSPRSLEFGSWQSLLSSEGKYSEITEYLHGDHEFLIAAETGDYKQIARYIRQGINIQQIDFLGRNALHLAVCSEDIHTIKMLLEAGVDPRVKDNVGMTPLSLSLMRNPSLEVAKLLFQYGAEILSRRSPTDTGLFYKFVAFSKPTDEEKLLIQLLLRKGGKLEDPDAPGGRQPLHFAAMSNNCELIRVLTDLGADLYVKNHKNQTPKDVAIAFRCREAQYCLEDIEYSNVFDNFRSSSEA